MLGVVARPLRNNLLMPNSNTRKIVNKLIKGNQHLTKIIRFSKTTVKIIQENKLQKEKENNGNLPNL